MADSLTKVVNGAAFEHALQDLCIRATDRKITGDGAACRDHLNAKVAMMVGATLLSSAARQRKMRKRTMSSHAFGPLV